MNLVVGLISKSASWEQILQQEGLSYLTDNLHHLVSTCSVLVISRTLDTDEKHLVEQYLAKGGAIFAAAGYIEDVCGTRSTVEWSEYIVGDRDGVLGNVALVDVGAEIRIPREANQMRTQHNNRAVAIGPLGGGFAAILPFDLATLATDTRSAHKSFYAEPDRLPSERVSLVNKAELQHLFHSAMKYLHNVRMLPYAHAWYFPDGRRNVFAFRIDTDKGSRNEIDSLYHAAREFDVKMTWFLDVKSHEDWLQHFAFLSGQEIGVHCYEHQVFDSFEDNLKNINTAKQKLERMGISSPGFSAPFGRWNTSLAKAIEKVDFEYSSEFSYAYDALPQYPGNKDLFFDTLQVPIHPICIGSLMRSGYTENQMNEYFRRVIDAKLVRDEPLFFYHHPTHHGYDVMKQIFRRIDEHGIDNLTMLEYARWWKKRIQRYPSASVTNEHVEIHRANVDSSIWLRIIRPDGQEALVNGSGRFALHSLAWTSRPAFNVPDDIRRLREFDPRQMLGNVFSSITRKLGKAKSSK